MAKKQDDEIGLKFNLTQKQIQVIFLIILIAIPIFLSAYFRAYPASLPITENWAQQSVENFYRSQLTEQIRGEFPNLPEQQVQARVNEQFSQLYEQNRDVVQGQIDATSEQFKQQLKNENGETYLLAIDPWTYYQDAENLVDHGHVGDTLKDGKPWNSRMFAPIGHVATHNWHSSVMIFVWHILKIFKPSMSLMGGAFWVPVIISALATIPAFFIARRKAGNLGGFIAAVIVAVHGAFLSRTPGGFSDTDAYNVFFPLLVVWLFLEAFEAKEGWKKAALAAGSGILLGIYAKIWIGYWYIFDIILAAIIGFVVFQICKYLYSQYTTKKKSSFSKSSEWGSLKKTGLLTGVFLLAHGIVITALLSMRQFFFKPFEAIGFLQIKAAANPTLWPNVLTTVAELNNINLADVVSQMGGRFLFALAIIGLAMCLLPWNKKLTTKDYIMLGVSLILSFFLTSPTLLSMSSIVYLLILAIPIGFGLILLIGDDRSIDIKYSLIVLVWFLAAMFATVTGGVRFTLVLVPAFAIAIGTFAGMLVNHLTAILSRELEIPKKILLPTLAILLCVIILFVPIKTAHAIAVSEVPSVNDAWYQSLTQIRDNSAENAIITSWWDFGHWFKAIAERPVTFDGASQNTPMAHWVGKLLLSEDETQSIGILQMLDCGSYTGFDRLKEEMGDTITTKKLMDELILLNRENAHARLTQAGISDEAIEEILTLTHCEPPEAFLITSQDMVGKAGVWGHFGAWSFERAYIYNTLRNVPEAQATSEMIDKFGYTQETAQVHYREARALASDTQANSWISPWPAYASGWIGCQVQTAEINTSALGINTTQELEEREIAVCPTQLQVSQTPQGTAVVEAVLIDLEEPTNSRFRIGIYQGGLRVQGTDASAPNELYFAHTNSTDGIEKIAFTQDTTNVAVLFDEENARAMVMDPLHGGSLFTQLFFLEGKYNENFEKFSDHTSFNGQRIIVWKVLWEE